MTLQLNKKYKTRLDGHPARVVDLKFKDYDGQDRVLVIITLPDGHEFTAVYSPDGVRRYVNYPGEWDLLPDYPPKWVNIYEHVSGSPHCTREEADKMSSDGRIACISFHEGDGL